MYYRRILVVFVVLLLFQSAYAADSIKQSNSFAKEKTRYLDNTGYANTQQLKLSWQIRSNDDGIIFKATALTIESIFSHNDPGNLDLVIELYKNQTTLVQSETVTPTLTWAEEGFARAEPGGNPVEFDKGDWMTLIIWIKANLGQYVGIRYLMADLTTGS